MKIELKNIGKIRSATVDLDGITVIAGENDTGKSTVSKALYSVQKTLYDAHTQIREERLTSIRRNLISIYRTIFSGINLRLNTEGLARIIFDNASRYHNDRNKLKETIMEAMNNVDDKRRKSVHSEDIKEEIDTILISLNMDDSRILERIAVNNFDSEFNGQITNIYTGASGEIRCYTDSVPTVFHIDEDQVFSLQDPSELSDGVIYLDNPFVLDQFGRLNTGFLFEDNHRSDLQMLLFRLSNKNAVTEILTDEILSDIYRKITAVIPGEIIYVENQNLKYRVPGSDKLLDVRNLSAGMKTFAILKTLLRKGALESGSTVILDEPEIHLHPEWQLIFAELIILLRKQFRLRVLLTTHSPYFLEAIEVYAAKHGISDDCKYYLAHNEGNFSEITEVTNSVDEIYKLLAKPFQTLEDERYRDD